MKRLCIKPDLYWTDPLFDMVEKIVAMLSKVCSHIEKTNLYRYLDKTYDDTIKE